MSVPVFLLFAVLNGALCYGPVAVQINAGLAFSPALRFYYCNTPVRLSSTYYSQFIFCGKVHQLRSYSNVDILLQAPVRTRNRTPKAPVFA
jgi:hypothetical protein